MAKGDRQFSVMNLRIPYIALIFIVLPYGYLSEGRVQEDAFPDDFMFGVATAAYQVEGAWSSSDKGESVWDRYTHEHPERIKDRSNGDTAADSYHFWEEDIKLLEHLKVHFYRFSISWPRILPNGLRGHVSDTGIEYYRRILIRLNEIGVKPMVTLYHWDLPQALQDLGGWTNPLMADYFLDYAELMFETFGDVVKMWVTFNEPHSFCHGGYGGLEAPGHQASGLEDYMCAHNVLRAHAKAYRLYERRFKETQKGIIGLTLEFIWYEPANNDSRNEEAADRARQFNFGLYAHPIFSKAGDYPSVMRQRIDANSALQNYSSSRLPRFTGEELTSLKGSADFLGFNHYTTVLVREGDGRVSPTPSFENDLGTVESQDPNWPTTNSSWIKVVPWGFRKALNYVRQNLDNPHMLVTENGVSTTPGLKDQARIVYMEGYLRALLAAVRDGCDVRAYTYWSLIDNFEWLKGYTERFGLFEVNYDSVNKTRTPRDSAHYYKQIINNGKVPPRPEYYSYTN